MKHTRRTLLKSFAAIGAVSLSEITVNKSFAHPCDLPVRRNVAELDLNDPILETYREFVTKMKEKPADELVSWEGFTSVHGTETGGFNFCPHGSWYFLPWHRAYVHMYEVMCRELTGNKEFAMPYWDWTQDRQLPKAFSDEQWQGNPNPLFDNTRTVSPMASLPDEFVGQSHVMDDIFSESNFELFGTTRPFGQNSLDQSWITNGSGMQAPLENNPHNQVHCWIALPGHMCSAVSPRDPIFMLHHGNIDRIWAEWNNRSHSNTTDPLWLDMEFQDNFISHDGTRYTKIVRELEDYESLGYTYELSPQPQALGGTGNTDRDRKIAALFSEVQGQESVGLQRIKQTNDKAAQALDPLSVKFEVGESVINQATESVGLEALDSAPEILALIKNITPPENGNANVRVFINCDYLSQEVPVTDPHYVTTFAFFGAHGAHGTHKALPSIIVNLNSAIKNLARAKLLTGNEITVQLLPVPKVGIEVSETDSVIPAEIEIVMI